MDDAWRKSWERAHQEIAAKAAKRRELQAFIERGFEISDSAARDQAEVGAGGAAGRASADDDQISDATELIAERRALVDNWKERTGKAKKALYEAASQDKSEYYKWERGELPNGSRADLDIRKVLRGG